MMAVAKGGLSGVRDGDILSSRLVVNGRWVKWGCQRVVGGH